MIFVDSGAWFSTFVPMDQRHREAMEWFHQNTSLLITTDYVVDETLTLLRARGEPVRALAVAEAFFRDDVATIHFLTEQEIRTAAEVFRKYADKAWSFTDCTSKVAMESLNLTVAFAFDHHFHQFGGIRVVPQQA
jgi:uncharacterized protein